MEFKEVTRALGPRSMIVFIDDLDRCRPDQVREVLEAVNFMVSSGDCFIVLGMARETVEHCVGLSFKDVAEEIVADRPQEANEKLSETELGRRKRVEFARHYLDKIVNIEVPLPKASDAQARKLLIREAAPQASPLLLHLRRVLKATRTGVLAGMVMLLFVGSYGLGAYLAGTPAPASADKAASATKTTDAASLSAGTQLPPESGATIGQTKTPAPAEKPKPAAEYHPAESPRPADWQKTWPAYFVIVFLLALMFRMLTQRPDLIVRDSPTFEKALDVWYPLVIARHRTPRSVKRFMNRVRYFAMRQRPQRGSGPFWKRVLLGHPAVAKLANRLGRTGEFSDAPGGAVPDKIPESILVALAAIHQMEPDWVQQDDLFSKLVASRAMSEHEHVKGSAALLLDARAEHEERFGNWSLIQLYREEFQSLCAGITVR